MTEQKLTHEADSNRFGCREGSGISALRNCAGAIEGRPSLAQSFPRPWFCSHGASRTSPRIILSGWFAGTRGSGMIRHARLGDDPARAPR
jgi:hypothetical protein